MLPQNFLAEKCCLFDRRGRLLWRSPAWTDGIASPRADRAVLGFRYLEFVYPADVAPLLAWFAADTETAHSFCCMLPASGRMARVHYVKFRYGADWLVFGAARECSGPCSLARCVFDWLALAAAAQLIGDPLLL